MLQSKPEVACTEKTEFTNIPLEAEKHTKLRKPRRILHFSDGVLEEYSSDEEEPVKTGPVVDPVSEKLIHRDNSGRAHPVPILTIICTSNLFSNIYYPLQFLLSH